MGSAFYLLTLGAGLILNLHWGLYKQRHAEKIEDALLPLWLLKTLLPHLRAGKGSTAAQIPESWSHLHHLEDSASLGCCHVIIQEDEEKKTS